MREPPTRYATAARFERSTVDMAADRPILEPSDLVLACAHMLHTNGQSTHETVQAAERLGTQLGLRATMIAHWENPGNLRRIAPGNGHSRRLLAGRRTWQSSALMAGRDRCRRGGRRIQGFFFGTIADVWGARRDRHAGPSRVVGGLESWGPRWDLGLWAPAFCLRGPLSRAAA